MNQQIINNFFEEDKKKAVKKPKSDWKKKIYKNFEYDRKGEEE